MGRSRRLARPNRRAGAAKRPPRAASPRGLVRDLATSLARAGSQIEVNRIAAESLAGLPGVFAVGAALYDREEGVLVNTHLVFPRLQTAFLGRVTALAERRIVGMKMRLPPGGLESLVSAIVQTRRDTHEATFGAVPLPAARLINAVFRLGAFHGLGLTEGHELLGTLMVVMKRGASPVPAATRETVARICANALARLRAREELRKSEERFRTMVEELPLGVFEADVTGRVTYANRTLMSLLGYDGRDIARGKYTSDVVAPEDLPRLREALATVLAGRVPSPGNTYTAVRRDGSRLPVRVFSAPIRSGATVCGLRGQVVDLTELRRAEKALEESQARLLQHQRIESLGTLAGGIAHDFNNLLGGIMGYLELIKMKNVLDDGFRRHVRGMEAAVGQGAELTAKLLGFARRGKYAPEPLDLSAVAEETCAMYSRLRKDVEVRMDLAKGDAYVVADRAQMGQVVLNLLMNAGQAMPRGGTVTVRTETVELAGTALPPDSRPGRFVRLAVIDDGCGMDAATRARIFEPFFTTKDRELGTGLGLPMVFGIVRNHGGGISVESEPARGSSFTVTIPATDLRPGPRPPEPAPGRRGSGTILLADDEEMIRATCGEYLREIGYDVILACNGREAVDAFRDNAGRLSLVVLDLVMPVAGGAQAFEEIRSIRADTPILVCSGYSLDGQAEALLARGRTAFLQKPFKPAAFAAAISALLR